MRDTGREEKLTPWKSAKRRAECWGIQLDELGDNCCWEHFWNIVIKVVTFSVSYLWQHCQWIQPVGRTSGTSSGGGGNLKEAVGCAETLTGSPWLINHWEPSLTIQAHLSGLILPCHFHVSSFIMCWYCTTPMLLRLFVVKKGGISSPQIYCEPIFLQNAIKIN